MSGKIIEIKVFDDKYVVVRGSEKYPKGTTLDPLEVAFLIYEGKAVVFDNGKVLSLKDLVDRYSDKKDWWLLFTVLHDLYKRGRIVKRGFSENDLILEREGKKYRIFVTEENVFLPITLISEWIESSIDKGYIPVIAVVDMHGDVTYYKASKYMFKKLDKEIL
jgi:tRNA splicing endonuclease